MDVFEKQVGNQEKTSRPKRSQLHQSGKELRYTVTSARCILDEKKEKFEPVGNYDLLRQLITFDCLCIHDAKLHQVSNCANSSLIAEGQCHDCHINGLCPYQNFTQDANGQDICRCFPYNHACVKGAIANGTSNSFLKSLQVNKSRNSTVTKRLKSPVS